LFDFEKTAGGAEWIDAFARRARQAEAHDGLPSLGHADWRVEHLRFDKPKIVATYDWDSLALRTETELVGLFRARLYRGLVTRTCSANSDS